MTTTTLEKALLESRVLVSAGTGGVGKTTIAAALAIQAALRGRRTLVLTIDPARRLADALGLASLDSKPASVDLAALGSEEPGAESATLDAMMLDAKPTFDRLIHRLTEDDDERLLSAAGFVFTVVDACPARSCAVCSHRSTLAAA